MYNLPKYGTHTREIYLESQQYQNGPRAVFENLRAIGDFCPNLVRLDLAFPLRLDLSATEADLPPKIGTIAAAQEETKAQNGNQTDEDVEMPDVEETALDDTTTDGTSDQMDGLTNAQTVPAAAQTGVDGGATALVAVPSIAQDEANDGGAEDDDNGEDGPDDDSDDDGNVTDSDDDDHEINLRIPQDSALQTQKRVCAEIDYIIKSCQLLENFSMQWTGSPALIRFHQRIPNLKGIRIWDSVNDKNLIATAKACRNLERVFIDDRYHTSTLAGLVGFLTALRTKGKSKLKRLGLRAPVALLNQEVDDIDDMDMDDDDEDLDDDGDGDGDGVDDGDDVDGADGDGVGLAMPAFFHPLPPPQPLHMDPQQSPLFKFMDVLSEKHPYLERLCLTGCEIRDNIVSKFGALTRLKSLDISDPIGDAGLSAVGISELVSVFKGKSLSALDLSGHAEMSDDDIQILTGAEGLTSLRYIKLSRCPKLTDTYIMGEWIHSDDLVIEDGAWSAADRNLLEIGEGWKEQWGD